MATVDGSLFKGVRVVDCSSAEDTELLALQPYEAWLGITRGARLAWLGLA